jgi:1,4-dihydroxy-6-naphthoate synthase
MDPIRIAISTCPNDTFAFHAMMHGLVDLRGLKFEFELLDIETLNQRMLARDVDVVKASFHAALYALDDYCVFDSGSALGYGVGPLLLAGRPDSIPSHPGQLTLCPGANTTATLLFRLFYPGTTRVEHVVFSEIMPQLQGHKADFGVCIHEGRFTWESQGLALVEDLGTRWERETGAPLPLGGIFGSKRLGATLPTIQAIIHDSVRFAQSAPEVALPTMRHYAQEFDDHVLMQHVDLYVNQWTVALGREGANALSALSQQAVASGLLKSTKHFEIVD